MAGARPTARCLPTAIVVFTLVYFVGIRLISLHKVHALLHNRDVEGVTVGAVIEVSLLILVVAVTAWRFRGPNRARTRGHTEPPAWHSIESGAGRPLST